MYRPSLSHSGSAPLQRFHASPGTRLRGRWSRCCRRRVLRHTWQCSQTQGSTGITLRCQEFTKADVLQYVHAKRDLAAKIGVRIEAVEELNDGLINSVFLVTGSHGKVVIKKAFPYVRVAGPSFPLDVKRLHVEADALQLLQPFCGKQLPQVLHFDATEHLTVQQYVGPPHQKLLTSISHMEALPGLAKQLANLVAGYLFPTSLLALDAEAFEAQRVRFLNKEIRDVNESVVLREAFGPSLANHWTSPQLDVLVAGIKSNPALLAAVEHLAELYRNNYEALLHNDLHAGNLLAAPGSVYLLDWEFATYGPMAYDIGSLLASLLLAYFGIDGMPPAVAITTRSVDAAELLCWGPGHQQEWLLQVITEFWQLFTEEFCTLWARHDANGRRAASGAESDAGAEDALKALAQAQRQRMAQLWQDSLGFAGCCMARNVIGMYHHPLLEAIADPFDRSACEAGSLHVATQLLLNRSALTSPEDLVQLVRGCHRGSAAARSRGELGW